MRDCDCAAAIQQNAHLGTPEACNLLTLIFQRRQHGLAIEIESEICGGCLHALQMRRQHRVTVIPENTFEQLKRLARAAQKFGFQQALAILFLCLRINHNAAAYAHGPAMALKNNGANRHAEHCLAGGRKNPDCPGIDASRPALQLVNDLHRPMFGRSGYGATGKKRLEYVGIAHFPAQRA